MPVYSHSRLSTYEDCPLKYKIIYIDKIKRGTEGVEAFLGSKTHETLKKCYDDIRRTKLNTLDELISHFDSIWERDWHEGIVITRKEYTAEHYRSQGRQMLEAYYKRYAPFDADRTIGTEMRLNFCVDCEDKYRVMGFVDRLSRARDGAHCIHDYKTSAHLPSQEEADADRQLALYQIGVKKRWPFVEDVRLVWHYLAFDQEIVSTRSQEQIDGLVSDTANLIDEIQGAREFLPRESALCDWCEFPDLCSMRKHAYVIENLPLNKYLDEPGVVLVNKYAELKKQDDGIQSEMDLVREALVEYAKREEVNRIVGTGYQVRIKFDNKLKFPSKGTQERDMLDKTIIEAGKWPEVSQLDTTALGRELSKGEWSTDLIDEIVGLGHFEESSSVYLSKLKEDEE